MQTLNNTSDVERYLKSGNLSEPFLEDELVKSKVLRDKEAKKQRGQEISLIEGIFNWVHHNVKYEQDKEFRRAFHFKRTAEEIWKSGRATGCTDFALVFSVIARQLNISTTILHTAEENWLHAFQNGEEFAVYSGHTFCECFYEGKWILVDPTKRKVMESYDPERLELDYSVGGNKVFVPYLREVDLGQKQDLKQHNEQMEELCRDL